MNELSPELKKLLSQARDAYSPADERVTAVRDALSTRLGSSRGGGGGGDAGGGGGAGLGFGLRAWLGIGLATALLGVGLFALSEHDAGRAADLSGAGAAVVIDSGPSRLPASASGDEPGAPAQARIERELEMARLHQDVSRGHSQPTAAEASARPVTVRARSPAVESRAPAAAPRTAAAAKSARAPQKSTQADGAKPLPPGDARPPRVASEAAPATAADARPPASESSVAAAGPGTFGANGTGPNGSSAPAAQPAPPAPPQTALPAPPALPQLDDSLAAEIALLRRASRALTDGRADAALALADEHEARFPSGRLRQERIATRVLALCSLGRLGEARSSTGALLEIAPRSPHLMKIRASCPAQVASSQAP